jgi:hypothetical protein
MKAPYLRPALVAVAALAVTGCTSNGYNHRYGYAGLSYGYASPYYGWYDDYYYPGSGYYVYERSGARHRWNDSQRHYWESRGGNRDRHDNWSGYHRDRDHDGDHRNWSGNRRGRDHDGNRWSGNRQGHDRDGDHDRGDHHRHR